MTHLEGLSKVSYATLTSGGHFAHCQVCRLLRSTCKGSRRAALPALGPSPVFGPTRNLQSSELRHNGVRAMRSNEVRVVSEVQRGPLGICPTTGKPQNYYAK